MADKQDAARDDRFCTVEEAIEDLKAGRMIVVLDDEDRENEGDVVCAAQFITPEIVNFMATHARGLICLPMSGERLDELEIPDMVQHNTASRGTAFCVSIEARRDVTTGISAADRSQTIKMAVDRGELRANGVVVPTVAVWSHTAPETAELDVVGRRAKSLDIWNSWSFEGVDSSWLGNAGILVESSATGHLLRCSDGLGDPSFDDLVVRIEVQSVG